MMCLVLLGDVWKPIVKWRTRGCVDSVPTYPESVLTPPNICATCATCELRARERDAVPDCTSDKTPTCSSSSHVHVRIADSVAMAHTSS